MESEIQKQTLLRGTNGSQDLIANHLSKKQTVAVRRFETLKCFA